MKKSASYFLIFIYLILSNGCEYLSSDPDYKKLPIEGNLSFNISESYVDYNKAGLPVIFFSLKTEKIYGCFNYQIITDITSSGDNVDVNILGIEATNICLTALGPASSRTEIDLPDGSYNLKIHSADFSDSYNLSVTDKSINIDGNNHTGTKPLHRINWRYPKNSFAYMCGTLTQDSSICNDFLDTLESKIDLQEFTFPDSGKIPYPAGSAGHYYDMPAKYFYYQSELEFNKIESILRDYKEKYLSNKMGYGISIINWVNKSVYSWLL